MTHLSSPTTTGVHSSPADLAVGLEGVRVRYETGARPVLEIEELTVARGERVAVIGPSGCGKTTLLRLINGYVEPEYGRISVLGRRLEHRRGRGGGIRDRELRLEVGFVFQNFNLVERARVFDNVLWGRLGRVNSLLSVLGRIPEVDKQIAMRAVEEVDLLDQVTQRADTLSGGQQQRVGVARVLAQEAQVVLADEPVSNLDPTLSDEILRLLVELCERHDATLVMSLHQPARAMRHARRIVGLRDGRVVWDGDAGGLDDVAVRTIYGREITSENAFAGEPEK